MTGAAPVNTNFREISLTGDTRGRRLEYARLLTAMRRGDAALTPKEMSLVVGEAEGSGLSANVYGRWEKGQRQPDRHWLEVVARLAGVDAAWLDLWPHAPEPEGYADWLGQRLAREAEQAKPAEPARERKRLPFKDETQGARPLGGGRKKKGGEGKSA